MHSQLVPPSIANASLQDSRKQLRQFFKRSAPDLGTTDNNLYGKRVPDMDRDSRLIWERLQDERHAWAKENWDGFANNYAPEKDWWKKPEEKSVNGKQGKGVKRGYGEIDADSPGVEDMNGRYEKKMRTEERGDEDLGALSPLSPIPMSAADFSARFGE